MHEERPSIRTDLEFYPLEHGGKQLLLIKDHLGLVAQGKAVEAPLYRFMALLNGSRSIRDLQMELNLVKYSRGMVRNGLPTAPWWSKVPVLVSGPHNPLRNWMSSAM